MDTWRAHAGPARDEMAPIADLARTGFESRLEIQSDAEYWFASPLDPDGALLGVTPIV